MASRDDDVNPFAAPMSDLEPESMVRGSSRKRVEYANFGQRLVAAIVDGILLRIVGVVINLGVQAAITSADTDPLIPALGGAGIGIIIGWLYYALQESSETQATLGKRLMGIIVTDMDGERVSFGRATGRHFGKILSGALCLVGYIIQPFTEKKQALHDIMAGTLVVKA